MPKLYVLYEHASGYGLVHVQEVEEVGAMLPTVERAITDVSLFKSVVKLIAFSPFKSGTNALDNVNSVSEGIVHDDLKLFLETNVPTGKKAKKEGGIELGVSDTRITGTIQEELGIKCAVGDAVAEVFRGLRMHFANMVKGLTPQGEAKAQLGLGHSYSRAKVKFNVHRADNMIIQSIALLDQLDKDVNTFSMRVKEWYSYHFPEMVKVVSDNYAYCRMVKLVGNRKNLYTADEALMEKMEQITMDAAKVKAIIDAAKMSMGMDISPIDLINIESFSTRVVSISEYRKGLVTYLHNRMGSVAPNLSSLIGDMVGARLISHAGSLTNLAKYPASTVQILGAEKALFRALKTKGNTPKYGLIFHSTFIGRAEAKNKGRISRFLANKCSIASRIDCFSEQPCNIFGERLKEQVEERLKFFESGVAPKKNIDVMKEAMTEVTEFMKTEKLNEDEKSEEGEKKKKKKKRKSEQKAEEEDLSQIVSDDEEEEQTPAKKVKLEKTLDTTALDSAKKKKKKKRKSEANVSQIDAAEESIVAEAKEEEMEVDGSLLESAKKKKKKKRKSDQTSVCEPDKSMDVDDSVTEPKKKKKKAKMNGSSAEDSAVNTADDSVFLHDTSTDKKTKKKKKVKMNGSSNEQETEEVETPKKTPKKKKKKKDADISQEDSTAAEESFADATPKKTKKKKRKSTAAE